MLSENQKVLLKKDNCYRIVVLKSNKIVEFDRLKFSLSGLIGQSFGSSFMVENGNLVKVANRAQLEQYERIKVENLCLEGDKIDTFQLNMTRDNRNMNLNAKTQMMSAMEIDELKKNGESGDRIMEKLIENSTSFNQKTTYAQEKYLKKKKRRYMPVVSVHRITTRMLCELYGAKGVLKIMNLRVDTVSQILAYSNASSGSKIVLAETCAGLLLGSLIEKNATIVNFFHGSAPQLPECYSDWRELEDRVFCLPLGQLAPLAATGRLVQHYSSESAPVTSQDGSIASNDIDPVTDAASTTHQSDNKRRKISAEAIAERREERDRRRELACRVLLDTETDGVIVAVKWDPIPLTLRLLQFLAPGKPFVVFSQFLRPLVDLYDVLRRDRSAPPCCSLNISESWLRQYQVLPERTHPHMSMSGTGGYLLTGIKLLAE